MYALKTNKSKQQHQQKTLTHQDVLINCLSIQMLYHRIQLNLKFFLRSIYINEINFSHTHFALIVSWKVLIS
jgi:hypothetical protein